MTVRYYSSVAAETTLVSTINNSATTIQIASAVGLPGLTPFTMALDYESPSEELVDVTNVAGTTLTVVRAVDGTSATSHNAGARVRHVSSARDYADSRTHENSSTGVHGTSGAIVDTLSPQTLDSKTLTNATLTNAEGSLDNITINNSNGDFTRLNGLAADSSDRFRIYNNPASANEVLKVTESGAVIIRNRDGADDANNALTRLGAVKSDGTTSIWGVNNGGTASLATESGVTGYQVVPRTTADGQAFNVRDSSNVADVVSIWNNGRMDLTPTVDSFSIFDITAMNTQSAAYMRILDGVGTIFSVGSSKETNANGTLNVRNDFGAATDVVLEVTGNQTSQTGDLTRWVDDANVTVARINNVGKAFLPSLDVTGTSTLTGTVVANSMQNVVGHEYRPMDAGSESFVFSAVSQVDVNVVFGVAFPTAPRVICSIASTTTFPAGSSALIVRAFNITTTGMTLRMQDAGGASRTLTIPAHWCAIQA